MKNTFLPFLIGEQYEKWEFDLEYCIEDKIKGCDSYIYLWKKTFLNIIPTEIELIFSLDILQLVIMTCEFKTLEELSGFRNNLEEIFGNAIKLENDYFDVEIIKIKELDIWLSYKALAYRVDIIYGRP